MLFITCVCLSRSLLLLLLCALPPADTLFSCAESLPLPSASAIPELCYGPNQPHSQWTYHTIASIEQTLSIATDDTDSCRCIGMNAIPCRQGTAAREWQWNSAIGPITGRLGLAQSRMRHTVIHTHAMPDSVVLDSVVSFDVSHADGVTSHT